MPDLSFTMAGVASAQQGLTPLLSFSVDIENAPDDQFIQSIILQAQIRIEPVRRQYTETERERLVELFGEPKDWDRTLHDRLLSHTSTTVPSFRGRSNVQLHVPCTFDLNVATAKYFYGLEGGEIPLILLFSGTVFYKQEGRLLIQQIPWEKECRHRLPVERWRQVMDEHYRGSGWFYVDRELFDELYDYKRRRGLRSWDDALRSLLASEDMEAAA